MEYLILHFTHAIEDIVPWSTFIEALRPQLARSGAGEFESDDMAIDGGDCKAVFRGPDAKALSTVLLPHFHNLPFLQKPTTKVELVFGEPGGSTKQQFLA